MSGKLEPRVRRLEATNLPRSPLDELTSEQVRALIVLLNAQLNGEEVSDDLLWRNAMSRASYEAALSSVSPEMEQLILAWCKQNLWTG